MTGTTIRGLGAGILAGLLISSAGLAQSTNVEEFTDEDFAQFFGLLVDGKISRDKLNTRCKKKAIGFTFAASDLVQNGPEERIEYNKTGLTNSIDGRSLRSKHHNAAFGEWTGAVFKPICPGLFVISIDFTMASDTPKASDTVMVHLYLRQADGERPGRRIITAIKTGPTAAGSGHGTVALPLRTGDEISTYAESPGGDSPRTFQSVTFTGYKIVHLEDYVEEFDMQLWSAELEALN